MTETTEQRFNLVRLRITHALLAYLSTPHGQSRGDLTHISLPVSYHDMIHHRPTSPENLPGEGLSSLLIRAGRLDEYTTTGTSGKPRSVFWPANPAADVETLVQKFDTSQRTTSIYSSAVADTDIFLKTHLRGLRDAVPTITTRSFATIADVSEIVRTSKTIVLTDYPSAFARFVRLTFAAVQKGKLSSADVRGTNLVARLTGEPMAAGDLRTWHQGATELGYNVFVELRYGCTELLGIGKSDFDPAADRVEYRLTDAGCFVEVLDRSDLTPIYEGRGLLCATSYRTSGTILYRYLLGDEVEVFESCGERYVRDIRRDDALIVTGNTASLSDLAAQSRASTRLELCLEVTKRIDRPTGVQFVDVLVYVPSSLASNLDAAGLDVRNRFLDALKLRPAVASGFVVLTVESRTMTSDVRRKAWRLTSD